MDNLTIVGFTHQGHLRQINEDAISWDANVGFIGVADGMGGHNAGEVASALALDTLRTFIVRSAQGEDFTWPYGVNPRLSFTANRLVTGIKIANRRVFRVAEERAEYTGMGTTLSAAVVESGVVTFSNIGDSRIYSFDGEKLTRLTKDDSWIVMLSESGIDPASLTNHPMRNALTNVIGAQAEVQVETHELPLGSLSLLFCTDGVHGLLSDTAILEIVRGGNSLESVGQMLVRAALDQGGKDNVSVVLARMNK